MSERSIAPVPILLSTVLLLAAAGRSAGATPDDIAAEPMFHLIVQAANPVESLSREDVAAFFLLADQTWEGDLTVEPVHRLPDSEIRTVFERQVYAKSAAAVDERWRQAPVAARSTPVTILESDRAVIDWVGAHPGALGYVSLAAVLGSRVKRVVMTNSPEEEAEDEGKEPTRVSLVLDASGSMRSQINGRSKIEIARQVIQEVLASWDSEIDLGLVAFGHREGGCDDIEVVVPVDLGGAAAVSGAVMGIEPKGATPLTRAALRAAEDVSSSAAEARVVLVSDGQESCGQDPCQIPVQTEGAGVGFVAYVVGFDVLRDANAQSQMRCLAQSGGGSFQLAWDAKSLAKALRIALAKATGSELSLPVEEKPLAESAERVLDLRLEYIQAGEVATTRQEQSSSSHQRRTTVRVSEDYWMTDSEITQGDWQQLMGGNPSYFTDQGEDDPGELRPVERVNVFDAMAFANRLSDYEGLDACYRLGGCQGTPGSGCGVDEKTCAGYFCSRVTTFYDECDGYRLPTPTQYHYAAQADRETVFWWGDELTPEDARCARNSREGNAGPEPARSMPANPFGLYEMHGNVAEWVLDTDSGYRAYTVKPEARSLPVRVQERRRYVPSQEGRRKELTAGGSWESRASACHGSGTLSVAVGERKLDTGFRLVRSVGR